MKIVIAPDSFKGSLSALQAAEAIKKGIEKQARKVETLLVPMADGGEGTMDSLIAATQGTVQKAEVKDPLGRTITAEYGLLGEAGQSGKKQCVIDTASASGLALLTEQEKNPLVASSQGTGQLMMHALEQGCNRLIIGLGGSATVDGGAGILQALGAKLLDEQGQEVGPGGGPLHKIKQLDLTALDPRLKNAEIVAACDVNNPLIGPEGAAKVFGPQKGASEEMVNQLETGLKHWADLLEQTTGRSIHLFPGAGAAGGIGGMLKAVFNCKMETGIDMVIAAADLKQKLLGAQLVITGEGQIDQQTAFGKTPYGVAKVAKSLGIPCVAIAGSVGEGIGSLHECGITAVFSLINRPMSLQAAIEHSEDLLSSIAEQIVRLYVAK